MIPTGWSEAAEAVAASASPPPIAIVCGPPNTGKSVFSRVLLNALLQRHEKVGYLNTDVGQPEFTPPGCQSLHIIHEQPPDMSVLCLRTPEKCVFFGDTNCGTDPKTYIKNVFSLYDYFLEKFYTENSKLPLIINTSGWIKGIGYDMLVQMLKHVASTHVVQLRVSADNKNLPSGKFWLSENEENSTNLIEIRAEQDDSTRKSVSIRKEASLIRDVRFLAYFRQCLPKECDATSYKDLMRSLASVDPYKIDLSEVKIINLHSRVSNSQNYEKLTSKIVGLGISSSEPWCVGLGIVRAIDVSEDELYVLTPVKLPVLEQVDTIYEGLIEIPSCLQPVQSSAASS